MYGLRPATPADREWCFALHEAAMRAYVAAVWGWDEAVQRGFHERGFDPARTQIVTAGGRDVGMLVAERRPHEIYLGRIELLPDAQGRGIGAAVIRDLIAEAAAAGVPLTLDVMAVNPRARALYERLGFRETGRTGHRVHMRIEDYR